MGLFDWLLDVCTVLLVGLVGGAAGALLVCCLMFD